MAQRHALYVDFKGDRSTAASRNGELVLPSSPDKHRSTAHLTQRPFHVATTLHGPAQAAVTHLLQCRKLGGLQRLSGQPYFARHLLEPTCCPARLQHKALSAYHPWCCLVCAGVALLMS